MRQKNSEEEAKGTVHRHNPVLISPTHFCSCIHKYPHVHTETPPPLHGRTNHPLSHPNVKTTNTHWHVHIYPRRLAWRCNLVAVSDRPEEAQREGVSVCLFKGHFFAWGQANVHTRTHRCIVVCVFKQSPSFLCWRRLCRPLRRYR